MAFRLSACLLTVSAFGFLKKLMKQFFTVQNSAEMGLDSKIMGMHCAASRRRRNGD